MLLLKRTLVINASFDVLELLEMMRKVFKEYQRVLVFDILQTNQWCIITRRNGQRTGSKSRKKLLT